MRPVFWDVQTFFMLRFFNFILIGNRSGEWGDHVTLQAVADSVSMYIDFSFFFFLDFGFLFLKLWILTLVPGKCPFAFLPFLVFFRTALFPFPRFTEM